MELKGRKALVLECCKQTLMGNCGRRLENQTANKDGDNGGQAHMLHVWTMTLQRTELESFIIPGKKVIYVELGSKNLSEAEIKG